MTDPTQAFRDSMSQLAAGVSLFTLHLDDPADDLGMTVTSLASASLIPPMVTVGVGAGTSMAPVLKIGLAAAISIYSEQHRDLAREFARAGRPTPDVLLEGVAHHRAANGALLLDDALATLEGHIARLAPVGDHWVAVIEIERSTVPADGTPLLYHRRGYL